MLDQRKSRILNAVVYQFIVDGAPVGSRSLYQRLNLGVSPATIRNELSKLEEMGYIYQPHTSAGRVPTDKGYRFYVDALAGMASLGEEEQEAIMHLFSAKTRELENLLQETTLVLSRLTKTAALVIAPQLARSTIKHIDLLELNRGVYLLVIITDTGRVEKRIFEGDAYLGGRTPAEAQDHLNKLLAGKGLKELEKIEEQAIAEGAQAGSLTGVLEMLRSILSEEESERIYWGGTASLMKYLDGETASRVEELMEALEKQYLILAMLNEVLVSKGVTVKIGFENPAAEMRDLSFVASSYAVGRENVGTVGVLGPTRMNYAQVIPMVEFTARLLSRTLEILRG